MTPRQFLALKEKADDLQREASQAEGALKQLKAQLKKEFGCTTIKEAKRLLKRMEAENEATEQELEKKWRAFKKQWGKLLEEDK